MGRTMMQGAGQCKSASCFGAFYFVTDIGDESGLANGRGFTTLANPSRASAQGAAPMIPILQI
jgi:hypothetical protein